MKKIELPKLMYSLDALEPYISKRTIEFHYLKHHQTYVDKLNALIENTEFEGKDLEYIIKNSKGAIIPFIGRHYRKNLHISQVENWKLKS
mgnify:CR=1 FL=1